MAERAVIVIQTTRDMLGRRWAAAVVRGTIHSYHPAPYKFRAWTARGAKRRGERVIRSIRRAAMADERRDDLARRVTGYDDKEARRG